MARVEKFIKINQIDIVSKCDLPMNKKTLDLAIKLNKGRVTKNSLPPIKVILKPNGRFKLKDGRHRLLAFKLNEIDEIKAKFYV